MILQHTLLKVMHRALKRCQFDLPPDKASSHSLGPILLRHLEYKPPIIEDLIRNSKFPSALTHPTLSSFQASSSSLSQVFLLFSVLVEHR